MKELQKYHACLDKSHLPDKYCERSCPDSYKMIYLADEADAAFAALRRQVSELQQCEREIVAEHAEEIERLKAERNRWKGLNDENQEYISQLREHVSKLRKQAERYEKLKGIGSRSLERLLWQSLDDPTSFDALVDQLPASGEAKKQPKTLLDFGYAPGDYFSTCLTCNSQIQDVDKRCYCCKTCAQAKLDKWNGREAQK